MPRLPQHDADKASEGVELPYYPAGSTHPIYFRIRFIEQGLAQALQELEPDERRRFRAGNMEDGEALLLISKATGSKIVAGWRESGEGALEDFECGEDGEVLESEDGEPRLVPVPYTEEGAAHMLLDPTYREWQKWVMQQCRAWANYRQAAVEETARD